MPAAAVFVVCERAYALRKAAIMPPDLVDAVINNRPLMGGKHTVLARIVDFAEQHKNDAGAVNWPQMAWCVSDPPSALDLGRESSENLCVLPVR